MFKKYFISFLVISIISISIISCTNNADTGTEKTIEIAKDLKKDTIDKTKEIITGDASDGKVVEKYKDNKKVSEFNLEDLLYTIKSKDVDLVVVAKEKDFFDAPKFELIVEESKIQAYDYEELITLKKDISAITENGLIISGSKIKWNFTPHYFTKGEVLVIYDGDSSEIISILESIFNEELF
ncbi:MAG: hypothetical protein ACRC5M_00200 [Anaeroplasmataceae bacterium]